MKTHTVHDTTTGQAPTNDDPLIGANMLKDAQLLWYELRALIHDHLQLAALETRRVGESLVSMVVLGVMVAVLLNGAWLGLVIAAVQILIEQGMVPSRAILLAVAVNLLLAWLLCRLITRKSRYLQFPSLLRSLEPVPTKHNDTESS